MANILHSTGKGLKRVAGWADQADVIINFIPWAGQAADVIAGIGEAGVYMIGGAAETAGDLVQLNIMDAGRRVVCTLVGTAATVIPYIEHSATLQQMAKLTSGDFKGAMEVRSLSEAADRKLFEKLGGTPENNEQQARNSKALKEGAQKNLAKANEAVQQKMEAAPNGENTSKLLAAAAFILPIVAAGKRLAEGGKDAAEEVKEGNLSQAARDTGGAVLGAGTDLVGAGYVDAALGANELLEQEGDIGKTIDAHRGVADRLQEMASGRDKDGNKFEAAPSKDELEKMVAQRKAIGPHTKAILANESRQIGNEVAASSDRAAGSRSFTAALREEKAARGNGGGIQRGGRANSRDVRAMAEQARLSESAKDN